MSSTSLKTTAKSELIIVGNPWTAAVLAERCLAYGHRPQVLAWPHFHPSAPADLPVTVGNGESWEKARLIFGEEMTERIWEVSEANFARVLAMGQSPVGEMERHERGTIQREKALLIDVSGMRAADSRQIDEVVAIEKAGELTYRVRCRTAGEAVDYLSSVVIVATERIGPKVLPWLEGKWIPVTLGSFTFRNHSQESFVLALFNGGADFAVRSASHLRLGSFRNLYEDKAVGFHDSPDPKTLEGVRRYFGGKGWIEPGEEPLPHVSAETLSCDGLPVVGALPDLPGVYVVGAFAGRTQNFFFEVADRLARGILQSSGFSGMNVFSTKRFV